MKKIIICIVAIAIIAIGALLLLNNGKKVEDDKGSTNNTQETDSSKKNMKAVNVKLTYMGADITPGKTFKEKSIAATATKSTLPSCAFDGEDNVYTYSNIELTANVNGSTETIYSVYFIDDTVKTNEGIKIGDSKSKMIEAYGDNYIDDDTLISYVDDAQEKQINFQIEDDIITGIEYILVLN